MSNLMCSKSLVTLKYGNTKYQFDCDARKYRAPKALGLNRYNIKVRVLSIEKEFRRIFRKTFPEGVLSLGVLDLILEFLGTDHHLDKIYPGLFPQKYEMILSQSPENLPSVCREVLGELKEGMIFEGVSIDYIHTVKLNDCGFMKIEGILKDPSESEISPMFYTYFDTDKLYTFFPQNLDGLKKTTYVVKDIKEFEPITSIIKKRGMKFSEEKKNNIEGKKSIFLMEEFGDDGYSRIEIEMKTETMLRGEEVTKRETHVYYANKKEAMKKRKGMIRYIVNYIDNKWLVNNDYSNLGIPFKHEKIIAREGESFIIDGILLTLGNKK